MTQAPTLADMVRRDRLKKLDAQILDDERHGRSRFPELEPDGADAYAFGYPETACPYACTAPVDAAGFLAPLPSYDIQKAAAWIRGYRATKALGLIRPPQPTGDPSQ